MLFAIVAQAQNINVTIYKDKAAVQGCIRVTAIKNNSVFPVQVIFYNSKDGKEAKRQINAGESDKCDITCTRIRANSVDTPEKRYGLSNTLWSEDQSKKLWENTKKAEKPAEQPAEIDDADKQQGEESEKVSITVAKRALPKASGILTQEQIIQEFREYIDKDYFLSEAGIKANQERVDRYVKDLQGWGDKDACIAEFGLSDYVRQSSDSLNFYRDEAQKLVYDFSTRFNASTDTNNRLAETINSRLNQRESDLNRLIEAMSLGQTGKDKAGDVDWWTIAMVAAALLIILLLVVLIAQRSKKRNIANKRSQASVARNVAPGIVVRRTTTSILKKQSLEDVMDNPAYLKIDCADFCNDSAVRKIYLKNTCVKDIYNMYAEDLRNPDNPKEDGCMVLGRWVLDRDTGEYYVSLEHTVRPGDDAVFSEYELNFGGKIKLHVAERLRKLRRETGMQYDMTCWVHSHPGLGVFFSNSDNNVQMQLKHPTHPLFLTAIVVDILTPEQELGIFTFKKDGTVNAKADLNKLYSLESLYKWAVDSDRSTFKAEDHYGSLTKAKKHYLDCAEVYLAGGAIIDMAMMATEQATGATAFIHGYQAKRGSQIMFVAAKVSREEAVPDNELIGCFLTASHCSIPSIRKAVANHLKRINFVCVVSSADDTLTIVPVLDGELCGDASYYGEENFEELKIWTRRKR